MIFADPLEFKYSPKGNLNDTDKILFFPKLEAEKKIYDEIPDTSLLTKAMEHYLKEYNTISKAPMPLVMFRLATEHTSR